MTIQKKKESEIYAFENIKKEKNKRIYSFQRFFIGT